MPSRHWWIAVPGRSQSMQPPGPRSMRRKPTPFRHGPSTPWHLRRWARRAHAPTSRWSIFRPIMFFRAIGPVRVWRMIRSIPPTCTAHPNWVANWRSAPPARDMSSCAHPGSTARPDRISSRPCSEWQAGRTWFAWSMTSAAIRRPRATWLRRSGRWQCAWPMTPAHPPAFSILPAEGRRAGLISPQRYSGSPQSAAARLRPSSRFAVPGIGARRAAPPIPRSG